MTKDETELAADILEACLTNFYLRVYDKPHKMAVNLAKLFIKDKSLYWCKHKARFILQYLIAMDEDDAELSPEVLLADGISRYVKLVLFESEHGKIQASQGLPEIRQSVVRRVNEIHGASV